MLRVPSALVCQACSSWMTAALASLLVRGNTAGPIHVGSPQRLHVLGAAETTVSHVDGVLLRIGLLQVHMQVGSGLDQALFIARIARERLQKEGNIPLMRGGQSQHPLFEIFAMNTRISVGSVDDVLIAVLIGT